MATWDGAVLGVHGQPTAKVLEGGVAVECSLWRQLRTQLQGTECYATQGQPFQEPRGEPRLPEAPTTGPSCGPRPHLWPSNTPKTLASQSSDVAPRSRPQCSRRTWRSSIVSRGPMASNAPAAAQRGGRHTCALRPHGCHVSPTSRGHRFMHWTKPGCGVGEQGREALADIRKQQRDAEKQDTLKQ